ncbi:hypothetical protein ACIRU3_26135 [Streptomyces sp. NPDC101151]|uniref:hypothetical protein n=1 Tax=Streptomyces sp. NPDC101151 TaxID=3366115 RepID=UPI0037F8DAE4
MTTLAEYDVRLDVRPYAGSHIQIRPEIARLPHESDCRGTSLCLDAGHVAYGGGDHLGPAGVRRRAIDR